MVFEGNLLYLLNLFPSFPLGVEDFPHKGRKRNKNNIMSYLNWNCNWVWVQHI